MDSFRSVEVRRADNKKGKYYFIAMRIQIGILFWFSACALSAQDIHWSQPGAALIYQNPAFTCLNSAYSMNVSYRNQWNAVNTNYSSCMLVADHHIGRGGENSTFGIGTVIYSDQAGDGTYRSTSGGVTVAGKVKMNRLVKLAGGLAFNVVQNRWNAADFSWGRQYNGNAFDAGLPSGEHRPGPSKVFPDISAGLALAYNQDGGIFSISKRNSFLLGYTVNHLNRAVYTDDGNGNRLHFKFTGFFCGSFQHGPKMDIRPMVVYYFQGGMMQVTGGCMLRYGLGQKSIITGIKKGSSIAFGAMYRHGDACIPTLELQKGQITIGISYDINVSGLSTASNYRGGMEFSLRLLNSGGYLFAGKSKF
jgi:type IX secretion system PorP/SprF family membrane protein